LPFSVTASFGIRCLEFYEAAIVSHLLVNVHGGLPRSHWTGLQLACSLGMSRLNTLRMKTRDLSPRSAKSKYAICFVILYTGVRATTKRSVGVAASGTNAVS
jgi:hypothetical protein